MVKKISIPYFHVGLKIVTPLIFVAASFLIYKGYLLWGVILIVLAIIILTTKYVTEINLQTKVCADYLSLLSFRLQEEIKKFNRLDRIIITKGDYSQKINTRSRFRQLDWVDYTGTLIFDNDGALNLLTRNEKLDLLKGLKEYAEFLQVGIEDRTTHAFYWIDLSKI